MRCRFSKPRALYQKKITNVVQERPMPEYWTKSTQFDIEKTTTNIGIYIQQCQTKFKMSLCVRKPTIWVPTRSDTNRAVQSPKLTRSLKLKNLRREIVFKKKRNCTIDVAKTKGLISFAVTAKLICAFVFAYADCCFSHAAAQMCFS